MSALVIISCSEQDPRIEPSRFFNITNGTTSVVKTAGGRTNAAINSLYAIDQSTRIRMIIIVQHSGCAWSPGTVDTNVRADIAALKASPYIRNEIPVIGYALDVGSGQLREVSVVRNAPDEEARRRVLSQMTDFCPYWN